MSQSRNYSNASQTMNELNDAEAAEVGGKGKEAGGSGVPAYKVAMLGSSGVGKTALTYQFTTSEYICAYDLSLDDDYGQKTVSVLLNGQETDLEVVDHPACEMSVSIKSFGIVPEISLELNISFLLSPADGGLLCNV